jgi:hypothetical protein
VKGEREQAAKYPEPEQKKLFLKLLVLRVVELLGATTPKQTPDKNNGISYDKNDSSPGCGYWLCFWRLRGRSKS